MPGAKSRKSEAAEEARRLDEAIRQAEEYLKGRPEPRFVFERPDIDAREIREALGLSRQDFAMTFGLSIRTVENWEKQRREPEGPARALLIAIRYQPQAVAAALSRYRNGGQPLDETHAQPAKSEGRSAAAARKRSAS